ncbi:6-phosphofructokinase 5 [Hibiscus syriacus]|uniref:6-phosphofructokinase 5 n=1 Tax=Hibiscus syriacus TaxID=106335 RepID=A0A6A2YDC5_HIBSY|nr:6-phosphofructokinase 5 [Hibiscus syriacus]
MGCSDFEIQSDDRIKEMVEKEAQHLPGDDYLKRLRSGDLNLSVRRDALDWILKASAHYHFGPLSFCLSINYLDRFLSVYDLPKGKTWTVQLLAVACLSIAAKMEETKVPAPVDLQVGEPKFVFEARTIYRMERINGGWWGEMDAGIDFLEFRPSEIAAAVAISVSGYMQTVAIDKAISSFTFVEKGRVLKCVELVKNLSFINGAAAAVTTQQHSSASSTMPQSPIGVLDAASCLSYKSEEITVGSNANSSPYIKRRKHDDSDNTTATKLHNHNRVSSEFTPSLTFFSPNN